MKKGWEIRTIGEIAVYQRGLTYTKKDEVDHSLNVVLRANNINLLNNKLYLEDLKYINEKIEIPPEKIVKKGSIIICTASGSKRHLGKIALIDKDYNFAFGGFMGQITPSQEMNSKYLFYALTSNNFRNYIEDLSDGVNINNLRKDQINNYTLYIPPLREQRRIVAVLDQAFAAIDKAIENTEKNLQNAQELIDSYLEKIIDNPLDNCKEVKLGDICNIARGGSPRPIASYLTTDSDGINWLRIGDTKNVTKYIYQTKDKIIPDGISKSRLVEEGDLILSNSMSFGHPYIMKTKACIHDGWLILKEKSACVYKDFLFYVLGSKLVYKQFDNFATGSTVRNLNIGWVKKVKIPLPPFPEQRRIVTKIDALHVETKKLEANYRQKLANLEELRQSFLQKAFAGELLPRKNVDFLV